MKPFLRKRLLEAAKAVHLEQHVFCCVAVADAESYDPEFTRLMFPPDHLKWSRIAWATQPDLTREEQKEFRSTLILLYAASIGAL